MILVVMFLALTLFAFTGDMGQRETALFRWIYYMPDSLRWFALIVTQLGNVWFVIGVVGLLFVVRWKPTAALLVFRNSVIAFLLIEIIKQIVGRERPALLVDAVTNRELAVFGYGFPSGHTALATVLWLTLLPYIPKRLRLLPFLIIGLVAWSRIYLGVHAPLDVLGGFIIGVLVVLLAASVPWPKREKHLKT